MALGDHWIVAPAGGGGFSTAYAPNAVEYNGTDDYLSRASDFAGNADSKFLLLSLWFRLDGGDGVAASLLANASNRLILTRLSTNRMQIRTNNAAGTSIWRHSTDELYTADGIWHHYLAACDYAAATAAVYVDGADAGPGSSITPVDDVASFVSATWGVMASPSGLSPVAGALAELYFAPGQYLDLSIAANRRRFRTAAGLPADLGTDGSRPTGTAPLLYLRSAAASAGTNSGTGGDMTVNGEPVATNGPGG